MGIKSQSKKINTSVESARELVQIRTIVPINLLIWSVPLGVAAQNIIGGIATIWLIRLFRESRREQKQPQEIWQNFDWKANIPVALSVGLIVVLTAATLNNQIAGNLPRFFLGHLMWILLPFLAINFPVEFSPSQKRSMINSVLWVAVVFGGIAITQWHWGWKISGVSFLIAPMAHRAQGLYSHPLTFAYVTFLWWPFALNYLSKNIGSPLAWFSFFGVACSLVFSESRTVIGVAGFIFACNLIVVFSGKLRVVLIAGSLIAAGLILTTDNPLGHKIRATVSGEGVDRHSEYPADRVVFWLAHLEMIKDKPLVGHGLMMRREDRRPYYEAIGYPGFLKMYPAHNLFLQLWVNGGLFALLIFLCWYVIVLRACLSRDLCQIFLQAQKGTVSSRINSVVRAFDRGQGAHLVLVQTLIGFALISLTQNSIQDSEVRYGFSLLAATALWLGTESR